MSERSPNPTRRADHVGQLLVEKRCEIYSRVAALVMDLEEAMDHDDGLRARYLLQDVRRTLRSALAFLTAEVYQELGRLEALCELLPAREGPIPAQAQVDLADRLQLLHVKLARSLKLPHLQDMEQIIALPARLKHKLVEEERSAEAEQRRREVEEQCWAHENDARDLIRKKSYSKAIKSLKKAIRLDATRAVFHNDLGVVFSLLGRNDDAVVAYRTAVSLNERFPGSRTDEWTTSYYNLGIALRKAAQASGSAQPLLQEAQLAFQEYVRLNATGPKVSDARSILRQIADQVQALAAEAEPREPEEAELA